MQPDQATFLANVFLPDVTSESAITRKVMAAVPNEQPDYKPDPKSMSAIELCWHIASTELWFLNSFAEGEFKMEEAKRPDDIQTPADVVAWYDKNVPAAQESLKALTAEQWSKILDFYGAYKMPAVAYLGFLIGHSTHHRGQLSVYIRLMGGKVPSIYGGSADEPFQGS
ncbi:MAG: DinB family protein [Bryobacter sp.]|jgi:uncharacterized damage-inducible protein DinB|nr:DinB family protein [Bryobacter sp.]